MFGRLKSIFTGRNISGISDDGKNSRTSAFKDGVGKVSSLIQENVIGFFADLKVMREKSKDLLKTNVNLGLKHLNDDKISDAIFRFTLVRLFWPNYIKSYYYLAHCYILKGRYRKADIAIRKLLEMDPSYEPKVQSMVQKIKKGYGE